MLGLPIYFNTDYYATCIDNLSLAQENGTRRWWTKEISNMDTNGTVFVSLIQSLVVVATHTLFQMLF